MITLSVLLTSVLYASSIIKPVDWRDLTDKTAGPDARAALGMNREAWKHAETEHFIIHFRDLKEAEMVYVRSEAYYQWVKEMFGVSDDLWTVKCQIYLFHDKALWTEFNTQPGTEQFPGAAAYTNGSELFLYLDPFYLSPQMTLAHEIAHVILFRFVKGAVPLALNEGFAEFMSSRALALQADGNEYAFRTLKMIPEQNFIPVRDLTAMKRYPLSKDIFYQESESLVRYLLLNFDRKKFYEMLRRTAAGEGFEETLKSIYNMDLDVFEGKFKTYAMVSSLK